MLHDVRLALRSLARRPAFATAAVLTVSVGIAATSAIFTLANAILLRPLPYADPARLVRVSDTYRGEATSVGYTNYGDWRRENRVFEEIALRNGATDILGDGKGESQRVGGSDVTATFFRVLGVQPFRGRGFLDSEEFLGDGVPTIVLTYGLWQRMYGGRSDIVGRTISFNNRPVTVVGIMPRDFWFGDRGPSEFFVPMRYMGSGRSVHQYDALARLKPGVRLASAQAQMSEIAARIEKAYPEARGWGVRLTPLNDDLAALVRAPLAMLSVAVGLLLVVACANLGSLLLVRTASRTREMAVRAALGAGRSQIARDLFAEALLLGSAGAVLGGFLGNVFVRSAAAALPPGMRLPMPIAVDVHVVAFCIGLSLLTTVLASLLPLWRTFRLDLTEGLRASGVASTGGSHHRLLQAAVAGQVALAALLLVAGGLLVSSLSAMQRANLGFESRDALTVRVQHLGSRMSHEAIVRFYTELLERVGKTPGVDSVAATWSLPLSGMYSGSGFTIEGRPAPTEWRLMSAQNQMVSPSFFSTLGIRLLQGRVFDQRDRAGALPTAVINRALAQRHWPGGGAVGARIQQRDELVTIVGVVDDVLHNGPGRPAPSAIYRPLAQHPAEDMFLAIRGRFDRRALVPSIRRSVQALDAAAVVTRVQTLEEALGSVLTLPRLIAACTAGFALAALLLAAVGLYGAIAQWVGQQRHEIGVRLALGAVPSQVASMVLRRGLAVCGLGLAVGLGLAFEVTGLMRSLLYGVAPTDVRTFAGVAVLLLLAAAAACAAPARRAASVDPMVTLRAE